MCFFCQLSTYNWIDYVNSLHRNGCYIWLKPMCFHNKVILLPMHITSFYLYFSPFRDVECSDVTTQFAERLYLFTVES